MSGVAAKFASLNLESKYDRTKKTGTEKLRH